MTVPSELHRVFAAAPSNRLLGLELVATADGSAEVAMPAGEGLAQETGVVHGGFLASLADTTAVYAVHPYLPDGLTMTSIEFKLNFLRPATVGGGPLVATARVVRRGRRVAVCDVDVWQDGEAVATGLFTYLLFEVGTR